MTKKRIVIFITIFVLLVVFIILRGEEDTWICDNGQWIKHGVPYAPMPEGECNILDNFNPFS